MIAGCLFLLLPLLYFILGGYWVSKHPFPIAYKLLYTIPFVAAFAISYGITMYIILNDDFLTGVFMLVMMSFAVAICGLLFNALLTIYIFILNCIGSVTRRFKT